MFEIICFLKSSFTTLLSQDVPTRLGNAAICEYLPYSQPLCMTHLHAYVFPRTRSSYLLQTRKPSSISRSPVRTLWNRSVHLPATNLQGKAYFSRYRRLGDRFHLLSLLLGAWLWPVWTRAAVSLLGGCRWTVLMLRCDRVFAACLTRQGWVQ